MEHKLQQNANDWAKCTCNKLFVDNKTKNAMQNLEEHIKNESKDKEKTRYKGKQKISRQRIVNIINPLKTGKTSKYFNPKLTDFIKNPKMLADVMMESITKLQQEDLSIKERVLYTNVLTNVYKTIYGNKNFNLNVDMTKEQLNKQVIELVTDLRDGIGQ